MSGLSEFTDPQAMYEEEWRLHSQEHVETVRKALNAPTTPVEVPKIVYDYVRQLEINLAQQLARSVVTRRLSEHHKLTEYIEPYDGRQEI